MSGETVKSSAAQWLLVLGLALLPLLWLRGETTGRDMVALTYIFPKVLWLRLVSVGLATLIGIDILRKRRLHIHADRLTQLILIFGVTLILAAVNSLDRERALYGNPISAEGLFTYLNYIFLFLVARAYAGPLLADRALRALLVSTGFLTFLVLVQLKTGWWAGPAEPGRPTMAAMGNGALLAGYLTLLLPLFSSGLAFRYFLGAWRYIGYLAVSLAIAVLILTQGPIVLAINAIFLAVVFAWAAKETGPRTPLMTALTVALLASIFIRMPVASQPDVKIPEGPPPAHLITLQDRQKINTQTLLLVPKHLFRGAGLDNYETALVKELPESAQSVPASKPFNQYLDLLISAGVFALCVYLLFWFAWAANIWGAIRKSGPRDGAVLRGILLSITGYLIFLGFFFSSINTGPVSFALAGLGAGLAGFSGNRSDLGRGSHSTISISSTNHRSPDLTSL